MSEQSYEHHAHRPTLTTVAWAFTLVALVLIGDAWRIGSPTRAYAGMLALGFAVLTLGWISRAYTVRLQDRIILLEMKVRGAELLTPEQETRLAQLNKAQIIALRFASDYELPELVDRAGREKLTPDQIKRAIRSWRPDYLRT